jgi:predicted component of type VI protein secretion system
MPDLPSPSADRRFQVVNPDETAGVTEPTPRNFVPLRLVLQPGGAFVDVKKAEIVLGRHSEANLRLALPDVSRRHCRLAWMSGVWRVFDLQSVNGTYVNGEPVNEATLHPGDLLQIGGFTFRVASASDSKPTVAYPEAPPDEADVLRSIAAALPSDQIPRRRAS